ncbi:MAG: ferrous iron transport protein B [Kiritimatiellia bacterium]|jgi:ferrous iron transport protein B
MTIPAASENLPRTPSGPPPEQKNPVLPPDGRVILVGNPNVGKSALFNNLTGSYVTVSNYPGTTVDLAQGALTISKQQIEVIDTPGMYSLIPISEEERISRRILFSGDIRLLVHVVDAKNIARMLGLTLQLAEAGLPMVLVLNMMDEARAIGLRIDCQRLAALLGLPVIPAVSITGEGTRELLAHIQRPPPPPPLRIRYNCQLEQAITRIAGLLKEHPNISRRVRALLLLQGDTDERAAMVKTHSDQRAAMILCEISRIRAGMEHSPHYQATLAMKNQTDQLMAVTVQFPPPRRFRRQELLNRLFSRPLTGIPVLLLVLYFGFYQLVGRFGAGTLVDWIETAAFENRIIPWTEALVSRIPWPALQRLFCGDYGIVNLGLRYAIAIILPIVGMYFAVFAILEDSGYLPRLALLTDRLFKKIGLNGRAAIPMALGFGCDTMATIVTRTLETKRERLIATILLALAIPCSAQLGVIMALLAEHPRGLMIWCGCVGGVFILTGFLAARLMPGDRPSFYMEMPPLRMPRLGNVLIKTYSRMIWYFKEVLPIFILASVILWLGELTHIFQAIQAAITPAIRLLDMPPEAAPAFLFGFFRRDYGAAGLYDLYEKNLLNGNQVTVAAVVMTLFLPCVAQFLVMCKERGTRLTIAISAGILVVAYIVGLALNACLHFFDITL